MSKLEKGVIPRLQCGRRPKYPFHLIQPDTWFRISEPPSENALRTYVSKRARELGLTLQVFKQDDGSFIIYRKAE